MKKIIVSTGSNYQLDICRGAMLSFTITVTGNITLSAINFDDADIIYLTLIQDATGSRTITLNSDFHWVGGNAPTLTTAANAVDEFTFKSSGTKLREVSRALDVK